MTSLTPEQQHAINLAVDLTKAGVPIFVAKPTTDPNALLEHKLPPKWQFTTPDPDIPLDWEPGDALCLVTGHGIDAIDVDPRNNGDIDPIHHLLPMTIGVQKTRSGGVHYLIPSLGIASSNGFITGVDFKGGTDTGGAGFIYLAPTERMTDDAELSPYEWVEDPDPDLVSWDLDSPLAKYIENIRLDRRKESSSKSYDGPGWDDLTDEQQILAEDHVNTTLYYWEDLLEEASYWDEGQRDDRGRGWEALTRDFVWALAKLATAPWTRLTEEDARSYFSDLLPENMARNPSCRGKWTHKVLEKAADQPVDLPPWWTSSFFEQTPVLTKIHEIARSRIASPEGLLAAVLARVLAEVPNNVVLPGIIGTEASLNFATALVGTSGQGKSVAIKLSEAVLGVQQGHITKGAGSGEGLIDSFLEPVPEFDDDGNRVASKGEMKLSDDPRVIYVVDEVKSLETQSRRNSGTFPETFRTAITGGRLQNTNATAGGRSRDVEGMAYRLTAIVGVQPGQSDALLSADQVASGTPQRYFWASLTDEGASIYEGPGVDVSLGWKLPRKLPKVVPVADSAVNEIREKHVQRIRGVDNGDGHAELTQLKVAFGLALLHGETEITDFWWELSSQLMERSREAREVCNIAINRARDEKAKAQAFAMSRAADSVVDDKMDRAVTGLIKSVKKRAVGEWQPWSVVRPGYKYRKDLDTSDIVTEAQRREPRLEVEAVEKKTKTEWRFKLNAE